MTRSPLQERLLGWYRGARRDLPWRATRDPYAILVSEIMLQQTTVRTVESRWARFLARFPSVNALAEADVQDVIAEWRGLGYYSRARNLHAAAVAVAREFGGVFPPDAEALARLPGIGPYTAAAVASIAFDLPRAVVDANVVRVMARLGAINTPATSAKGRQAIGVLASELLEPDHPGDWNQAVMELGAMVCLPRDPTCTNCPIAPDCLAHRAGTQGQFPVLPAKQPMETVRQVALLIHDPARSVFLLQRPGSGSFAGMWELPSRTLESTEDPATAVLELAASLGVQASPQLLPPGAWKHTVMRRRITLFVYVTPVAPGEGPVSGFRKFPRPSG